MKIQLNNITSHLIVGGTDHLFSDDLLNDIRRYMSVDVPGAWYTSAYKRHGWDGKKYYVTPKGKFPTGMLPWIISYIEDTYPDVEINIIDERGSIPVFKKRPVSKIGDFKAAGEYIFQRDLIRAFDHNLRFANHELYFPRGIIDAATNSGKMVIMAGIKKNIVGDPSMLVLIHSKELYQQLLDFMVGVFGSDRVGEIKSTKFEPKKVTIGMIKTVYNRISQSVNAKNIVAGFDIVCVDECHLAGSKTYAKVLKTTDAPIRVFVSGTSLDSQNPINKLNAISMSGQRLGSVTKKNLMDKGISKEVKVIVHLCDSRSTDDITEYDEYMRDLIYESARRSKIMYDILRGSPERPTLIAVEYIRHGHAILKNIMEHKAWDNDNTIRIEFVHGTDPKRDEKIQAFKDGKYNVLISTRILKEGVNIPSVSQIIYAGAGQSKIDLKQWMGRAERRDTTFDDALFHDFYDIGKYVEPHSKKRLKVYKSEGLTIDELYTKESIKRIKDLRY